MWELIDKLDEPSSSMFDFPALDLSSYTEVRGVLSAIRMADNDVFIFLQLYADGVLKTGGSDYLYANNYLSTSGETWNDEHASADRMVIGRISSSDWGISTDTGKSLFGEFTLHAPTSDKYKRVSHRYAWTGPTDSQLHSNGSGILLDTNPVTGLRISNSGSSIISGRVRLFGLRAP